MWRTERRGPGRGRGRGGGGSLTTCTASSVSCLLSCLRKSAQRKGAGLSDILPTLYTDPNPKRHTRIWPSSWHFKKRQDFPNANSGRNTDTILGNGCCAVRRVPDAVDGYGIGRQAGQRTEDGLTESESERANERQTRTGRVLIERSRSPNRFESSAFHSLGSTTHREPGTWRAVAWDDYRRLGPLASPLFHHVNGCVT